MNGKSFGTVAWTAFLKTLLLVFNLVFFAIGLAFLVIGIYGIKVFKNFLQFAPANTIYVPIICIGLFMMIVGILSLWCTPKGVSWLLHVYGVVVFVLFLSVMAVSVLFVVKRDAFEGKLEEGIQTSIDKYPNDSESIDLIQSTLKCCGTKNLTDWFKTEWAQQKRSVPLSCCKNQSKCDHTDMKNFNDVYQKGCYQMIYTTIESNFALISGISFASAIIILGGSLISCSLARNLNKNRYEQVQ
jgi:multisubunit Na+/H+ antiporter MnhG subunit